jgi:hypothetical protein
MVGGRQVERAAGEHVGQRGELASLACAALALFGGQLVARRASQRSQGERGFTQHHPNAGGDTREMATYNNAADLVEQRLERQCRLSA